MTVDELSQPNARFRRIMGPTTVNQGLNRDVADVAYDMAEASDD